MPDEDHTAQDISGDPPPATPMSQKQVAGAQKQTVNRTQLGAQPKAGGATSGEQSPGERSGTKADDKPDQKDNQQGQQNAANVSADTPILGGVQAYKTEADTALHLDPRNFNPMNGMDWLKHAAEAPVTTYQMGRHVYDAFFGAFLDSEAVTASVQNIFAQDNAQADIFKFIAGDTGWFKTEQQRRDQEAQIAGAAGMVLPIAANPWNILPFGGARGAALVALMMTPAIAQALFSKQDPLTALTWGGAAAMLFGGKLPPAVEEKLAAEAPGMLKLFDKIGATQRAIDKNRTAVQDRKALLDKILQQGQPEKNVVLAKAWDPSMTAKGADWEKNLSKQLMKQYGTLDRSKLIDKMYAAGAPQELISSTWTYLMKMPEPLMYHEAAGAPLVNPVSHMPMLPAPARAELEKGHHWSLHMLNQAEIGPAGNAAAPEASHWRSLIGMQDTNTLVGQQYAQHLRAMGGTETGNPQEQALLLDALEGNETAYQKLSPAMKVVRDEMRLVRAGLAKAAKDSGYSTDSLNNYAPRVHALIKDGKDFRVAGSGALLAQQLQRHRMLGVKDVGLAEEHLRVEQRYPTTQAAQQAVVRLQKTISDSILNGTRADQITGVPETDWDRIDRIRAIATSHPDVARAEADEYAKGIAPDFSLNPFDGISHDIQQLHSITAFRAVETLLNTLGKDGKLVAVMRPTNDERAMQALIKQGYTPVNARGFHNVLVAGEYGDLLARATRGGTRKTLGEALKSMDPAALAHIESEAVKRIMYSPRIHGMNMAFRLGVLGVMHPLEVTRWFKEGLIQRPGVTQVGHEEYRLEAWRARVIPPTPGTLNWADEISNTLADHTGDADLGQTPLLRDLSNSAAKGASGAKLVAGNVKDLLWGKQSDLWSWVSDFGVMAYHIEKAAAIHGGMFGGKMTEEEASQYAARRANSWMGHVAPEDTNPSLHAIAKTVTFAPNYWRSYAELLTGVYRRAGWGWSADTIKYVVQNEIKTALAAVAFQQLSANALNMMMSGHTIYQNDPGNWGKVEITQPWAIAALNVAHLGIDPKTGRNAKGQKLTMENPVARQMTDTEQALGLLTSSPHWDPATLEQGSRAFAAGRISPVVSALGALANIDLYSSIASGGTRYMDPNHDTLAGNPAFDVVAAAAQLTPFSYISNQIQQSMIAGQNPSQDMQGPFGTHIPKVITDTFGAGALAGDAARMLLVGLTGINPPYMRSSKSFGVQPTDDQYKTVHEIQDTYQQNMNALSTATLTGQMTPNQWIGAYRQLSTKRANQLQAIFKHAPEYNDGPLGLVNQWEGLYDQASVNGVTDPDKLRALQRDWRNTHSASDYAAMQSELRASDQKYPMLALYHKTLDAYNNWQSDYAKSNGIDLETLRSELSGYARVYGDRNATDAWLRDHPDILPFENAKKSEFESGNSHYGEAGLMYALFFNPTGAARYLAASGQTPQQVQTDVQAEQVPPAP